MTPEDTSRQEATVNAILRAFFEPLPQRREVQLLADEVGLGKTFVALATAYSVLRLVRTKPDEADRLGLGKCYRAVVVVVPAGNHSLANKWHQEVEALRTRCSRDSRETEWFQSRICDNAYDLVEGLRKASDLRRQPRKAPNVLICTANVFRRRVTDLGDRLRFLAACLFRWWGNKLNRHERYRIVSRAAETHGFSHWAEYARRVGTGEYEVSLWNFREHRQYLSPRRRAKWEWPAHLERLYEQIPFTFRDIEKALRQVERSDYGHLLLYAETERIRDGEAEAAGLLPYCKNAADRRGHAEWYFDGFKSRLLAIYKELAPYLIRQDFPLVIVDEAHHWRHTHRQDCQDFRNNLAPMCRRLLLLTATPFQLHRDELLEVLAVSDGLAAALGPDRIADLRAIRERIRDAMAASETAGQAFSREWGVLTDQLAKMDPRFDPANGLVPGADDPRTEEILCWWNELSKTHNGEPSARIQRVPGPLRPFFARALDLKASNERLRGVMHELVIRHRRGITHRRVWVGREYPSEDGIPIRPDQHLLHLAPGARLPPHAELAQYLLMKVVADASRGKHRTTLGMDLTGCYTTLWESKEGAKAAQAALSGSSQRLLRLLKQVTGHRAGENKEDARHPKVQTAVEEILRRWDRGEKSLVFCFRVPTAETLSRLLAKAVEQRLKNARKLLLESRGTVLTDELDIDKAMQQFRRSLTARDGSGVPLFLDRVLLGWLQMHGLPLPAFTDEDRQEVARLYSRAQHGGDPLFRQGDRARLDRVFLNRSIEHVWAQRLLPKAKGLTQSLVTPLAEQTTELLETIASPAWIMFRYGVEDLTRRRGTIEGDAAPTDTVARSSLSARYDLAQSHDPKLERGVLGALRTAPKGGRLSLADTLVTGPNLFVPLGHDGQSSLDDSARARISEMRRLLFSITYVEGHWNWPERAKVLDAVVRALLREDILLRMPRSVFRDEDETWAASILRGLHQPPGYGQLEPLAGRVEEFLKELAEMGPTEREAHLRFAMNPKAEAVVLVTGDTKMDRDAVFNGFNTPLLPDILICTQVGQEGIDLHRHCRHVIHYDLGWNPATLEQRTGRTDRIGSKALRERRLAEAIANRSGLTLPGPQLPGLDIALPFLAGTYDERMFDRLRGRAQVFEILTGGDPSADREGEATWLDPDDVGRADGADYVPLPSHLLDDLRVNLAVE